MNQVESLEEYLGNVRREIKKGSEVYEKCGIYGDNDFVYLGGSFVGGSERFINEK